MTTNEDLMRTIGRALLEGDTATARALAAQLAPYCDSTGVYMKYPPVREILDGIASLTPAHDDLDLERIRSEAIGFAELGAQLDAAEISILSMRLMPAEPPALPYWRVGVGHRSTRAMMVGHEKDHAGIVRVAEARGSWARATTMGGALADAIQAYLVDRYRPRDATIEADYVTLSARVDETNAADAAIAEESFR